MVYINHLIFSFIFSIRFYNVFYSLINNYSFSFLFSSYSIHYSFSRINSNYFFNSISPFIYLFISSSSIIYSYLYSFDRADSETFWIYNKLFCNYSVLAAFDGSPFPPYEDLENKRAYSNSYLLIATIGSSLFGFNSSWQKSLKKKICLTQFSFWLSTLSWGSTVFIIHKVTCLPTIGSETIKHYLGSSAKSSTFNFDNYTENNTES